MQILFFASAKAVIAKPQELLTLPMPQVPISDLADLLLASHAWCRTELKAVLDKSAWSLNECIVPKDEEASTMVKAGDTVAVIPPVSGG
jgi:molybdopterin converting factor small subunit